jgi:hypothetical protein
MLNVKICGNSSGAFVKDYKKPKVTLFSRKGAKKEKRRLRACFFPLFASLRETISFST